MRQWVPGEAWVFDDTIEHEARNDSDKLRVVLIFDVWHPHLTPPERALITALGAGVNAFGGSDLGPCSSAAPRVRRPASAHGSTARSRRSAGPSAMRQKNGEPEGSPSSRVALGIVRSSDQNLRRDAQEQVAAKRVVDLRIRVAVAVRRAGDRGADDRRILVEDVVGTGVQRPVLVDVPRARRGRCSSAIPSVRVDRVERARSACGFDCCVSMSTELK